MRTLCLLISVFAMSTAVQAATSRLLVTTQLVSSFPLLRTLELPMVAEVSELTIKVDGDQLTMEKVEILSRWPFFDDLGDALTGVYDVGTEKSMDLGQVVPIRKIRLHMHKSSAADSLVVVEVWGK